MIARGVAERFGEELLSRRANISAYDSKTGLLLVLQQDHHFELRRRVNSRFKVDTP